jgi:sugar phosphate isomerase/epimerase
VSHYGSDNMALIRKYPERIGYLHLKQVDYLAGCSGRLSIGTPKGAPA